jgi:hypothetical protein
VGQLSELGSRAVDAAPWQVVGYGTQEAVNGPGRQTHSGGGVRMKAPLDFDALNPTWVRLHFEVYPDEASVTDAAKAIATSQVALPKDACDAVYAQSGYAASVSNLSQVSLESDNVFGDDGGVSQLGSVTGDMANGLTISLVVGVDKTSTPSG